MTVSECSPRVLRLLPARDPVARPTLHGTADDAHASLTRVVSKANGCMGRPLTFLLQMLSARVAPALAWMKRDWD